MCLSGPGLWNNVDAEPGIHFYLPIHQTRLLSIINSLIVLCRPHKYIYRSHLLPLVIKQLDLKQHT